MKKRIDFADDDAGIEEMLVRFVESEPYKISLARSGSRAVAKIAAKARGTILPVNFKTRYLKYPFLKA